MTGEKRDLDLTALQLYEAASKLGFDLNNPDRLASSLKQIDLGIPAEDEFVATLTWMGRCKLIQKLRQSQHPRSSIKEFGLPDLLAIFTYEQREVPVLIQVKASHGPHLRFAKNYLTRQRRYAESLGLPLLVAWQWRSQAMWALFDSDVLADGKRLHFGEAVSSSLMGLLAGDFAFRFKLGAGVHFDSNVIENSDSKTPAALGSHGLLEPGWYRMKIRDAYFTNGDLKRSSTLEPPGHQVKLLRP